MDESAVRMWTFAQYSSMLHFRDRRGAEVDIVLELRFLASRLGDRFHFGEVLHTAPEATPFGDRLAALPVSSLWSG